MIIRQLDREFDFREKQDFVEFLRRLSNDLENHAHDFYKIVSVSADYTILDTNELVRVNTDATRTITLPLSADAGAGKPFIIKDSDGTGAGTNTITIGRSSTPVAVPVADTIDGLSADKTITTDRGLLIVVADGVDDYMVINAI